MINLHIRRIGEEFGEDSDICQAIPPPAECSAAAIEDCERPCLDTENGVGDCKCIIDGWDEKCITCPAGN